MSEKPKSFFDLVKTSKKPILVDFYADWCGPCKMVSPAIVKVAKDFSGKIMTIKIDVDKAQAAAAKYMIRSIPTIMLFKNGKDVMRLTGAQPYEVIKREVQKNLS